VARALQRLDRFFTRLNAGPHEPYAFHRQRAQPRPPWLYDWLGAHLEGPARGAPGAARALPPDARGACPGNDDGRGRCRAWWVLGALGLYPAVPGSDVLATWPARCSSARRCRLGDDRVTISAPAAARSTPGTSQALRVGGRPVGAAPGLRAADLRRAGRLAFDIGARPDRAWGRRARRTAPPSLSPAGAAGRAR
jgi:putative alpha-1,2-mannosidase